MPDYSRPDIKVKHVPMTSISLEALLEINKKLGEIQTRIDKLENVLHEKVPGKILTEDAFKQELQTTEDIIDAIVSKLKHNNPSEIPTEPPSPPGVELTQDQTTLGLTELTIVERKKIDSIKFLLNKHGQLTSTQLAQLMNMSRTRSNEYFKQMEEIGVVEPILLGKEKYYRLS